MNDKRSDDSIRGVMQKSFFTALPYVVAFIVSIWTLVTTMDKKMSLIELELSNSKEVMKTLVIAVEQIIENKMELKSRSVWMRQADEDMDELTQRVSSLEKRIIFLERKR